MVEPMVFSRQKSLTTCPAEHPFQRYHYTNIFFGGWLVCNRVVAGISLPNTPGRTVYSLATIFSPCSSNGRPSLSEKPIVSTTRELTSVFEDFLFLKHNTTGGLLTRERLIKRAVRVKSAHVLFRAVFNVYVYLHGSKYPENTVGRYVQSETIKTSRGFLEDSPPREGRLSRSVRFELIVTVGRSNGNIEFFHFRLFFFTTLGTCLPSTWEFFLLKNPILYSHTSIDHGSTLDAITVTLREHEATRFGVRPIGSPRFS